MGEAVTAALKAGGATLQANHKSWGPLGPAHAKAQAYAKRSSGGSRAAVPSVIDALRTPLPKAPSHSMYYIYGTYILCLLLAGIAMLTSCNPSCILDSMHALYLNVWLLAQGTVCQQSAPTITWHPALLPVAP